MNQEICEKLIQDLSLSEQIKSIKKTFDISFKIPDWAVLSYFGSDILERYFFPEYFNIDDVENWKKEKIDEFNLK